MSFLDTGLVCYLLGIDSPGQLANHPLRGAIFETFVMTEFWKHYANGGVTGRLFHYRDGAQREIDLLDECSPRRLLVEIKSGQTPSAEWGETLKRISAEIPGTSRLCVVYGGRLSQVRSGVEYVPWSRIGGELFG